MKQWLLNIGNTHTQVAEWDGTTLQFLARYDTSFILEMGRLPILENLEENSGKAVCVVPAVTRLLSKNYTNKIRFLTKDDFPMLDFSKVDSSTIGMDRIANAAYAFTFLKGDVVIIDCGTCINTVAINRRGEFLGGAILPGRMLLRKTLASYTAQLPLLEIVPEYPAPLGSNTRDAMLAGMDGGIIGAVKHLLEETRVCLGKSDVKFMATGGDAPYFLRNIPELCEAPDFLTLRGVACAR